MGFIVTFSFVEIIYFDHINPYTVSCHSLFPSHWLTSLSDYSPLFLSWPFGGGGGVCKTSEVNLGLLTGAWVTGYSQEHRQLLHFTFEIVWRTKINHQVSTTNPLAYSAENAFCLRENFPALWDSSLPAHVTWKSEQLQLKTGWEEPERWLRTQE